MISPRSSVFLEFCLILPLPVKLVLFQGHSNVKLEVKLMLCASLLCGRVEVKVSI